MLKFDSNKNYYRVLGVSDTASKEEIDRAYRAVARKLHPDGGGDEEEMKRLNEARDILCDPVTRRVYDSSRQTPLVSYGSSIAFDPEAASKAGTLKIPVADEDFAGLCLGAATCFGVGIPLLLLVETQWVFFLWPLRMMSLGALGLGVLMAHSALAARHHQLREKNPTTPRSRFVLREVLFWSFMIAVIGILILGLYVV